MIDGIVKEGHGQFCVTYYHNTDRVVPKVVEKWLRVQSQIPGFTLCITYIFFKIPRAGQ